jgi:hypothetical protein
MAHGYKTFIGENCDESSGTGEDDISYGVIEAVLTDWFFGPGSGVTYFGILKRWSGATWVKEPFKNYLGTSWQPKSLKRWNGSQWALIDTTGI